MENNHQQILSETMALMASVRNQLEVLDAKIALWQQMADPQLADAPIELDFQIDLIEDVPVVESVVESVADAVEPVAELEIEVMEPVAEVVDDAVEMVAEPEVEVKEPVAEDYDLPFFDVPEVLVKPDPVVPEVNQIAERQTAVIDVMTQKHAWRTAMPGTPVKDVRGAIALMDRVLFINNLFGTDAMAFQEALNRINQMQTLDEAVEYLAAIHPEWDFESQIVYSFMMAVRRKVN